MDIQDLGAIGEFVGSIVVVITLVVLVFEVRSSRKSTIRHNVLERQRERNEHERVLFQALDLADAIARAGEHLGRPSPHEEFGLTPGAYLQLSSFYSPQLMLWRDAKVAEMSGEFPANEMVGIENRVRGLSENVVFRKWYSLYREAVGKRPFAQWIDGLLEEGWTPGEDETDHVK